MGDQQHAAGLVRGGEDNAELLPELEPLRGVQ